MKSIFKTVLIVLCSFLATPFFAQLDKNKKEKGSQKLIILNTPKKTDKQQSLDLNDTSGFKKAYKKEKEQLKKKQKEEALNKKGILTPELYRKIKYHKFVEKNSLQIPMIDKDIGVFRTKSENMNLFCFDFGTLDGDKITILKNGIPFIENITLLESGKLEIIKIPLNMGFNKIEILAVNEGTLRPNTGAFTLFDDFKKKVFSDLWQLTKGAKVIAHIIREKP